MLRLSSCLESFTAPLFSDCCAATGALPACCSFFTWPVSAVFCCSRTSATVLGSEVLSAVASAGRVGTLPVSGFLTAAAGSLDAGEAAFGSPALAWLEGCTAGLGVTGVLAGCAAAAGDLDDVVFAALSALGLLSVLGLAELLAGIKGLVFGFIGAVAGDAVPAACVVLPADFTFAGDLVAVSGFDFADNPVFAGAVVFAGDLVVATDLLVAADLAFAGVFDLAADLVFTAGLAFLVLAFAVLVFAVLAFEAALWISAASFRGRPRPLLAVLLLPAVDAEVADLPAVVLLPDVFLAAVATGFAAAAAFGFALAFAGVAGRPRFPLDGFAGLRVVSLRPLRVASSSRAAASVAWLAASASLFSTTVWRAF